MSGTWPVTGGCHCGSVRYEIAETDLNPAICHCRDCQRVSGATFVVWLGLEPAKVTITGELSPYRSSKWATRSFCPKCGTTVAYSIAGMDEINIAGGTLDDPDAAAPRFQIFPKSSPRFMRGFDKELPVKDVEGYFNGLRER